MYLGGQLSRRGDDDGGDVVPLGGFVESQQPLHNGYEERERLAAAGDGLQRRTPLELQRA